jgi:hypothetical protein
VADLGYLRWDPVMVDGLSSGLVVAQQRSRVYHGLTQGHRESGTWPIAQKMYRKLMKFLRLCFASPNSSLDNPSIRSTGTAMPTEVDTLRPSSRARAPPGAVDRAALGTRIGGMRMTCSSSLVPRPGGDRVHLVLASGALRTLCLLLTGLASVSVVLM